MKKKSKKIKNPRIVLNSVLDGTTEALDFNKKTKGYKFLNILIEFGKKAIIINWAAQGMGFGQVTYYFNEKNKMVRDAEGLKDNFCNALLKEIEKRQSDKLKVKIKGLVIDGSYSHSLLNYFNEISIKT